MGKFSGIQDASVSGGGVYFLDGVYTVEIEKVFMMTSRKREDLFIVEGRIVESTCPSRRAGTSASWVVNMKHDAALGNIKSFVGAANGIDPSNKAQLDEEVTEEVCEYVTSDENPLAGLRLSLECTTIKTRAGGDFTLHKWSPSEA